eukprot:TRINITY_DN17162_c0_g1_i1.p1 TRINITY_DN17162_c0_g1~~TRINITY_DN17162_c0_g1_i1.p1  ORF type:complete len:775 (-),score=188.67 TRINITY_DN17162_c0_g1_i1:86-2410(-)
MELLRTRFCDWQPVAIDALALAPAGAPEPRLAVGRSSGTVELWDTETWHLQGSAPGCERRAVRSFAWVPTSSSDEDQEVTWRLLSAGLHGEVTEWDTKTLRPVETVAPGGGAIWCLCADSVGRTLYAACDDGTVRVFDVAGGVGDLVFRRSIRASSTRVLSVTLSGDANLIVGGSDSLITKWSTKNGTCEAKMKLEKPPSGNDTLVWSLAGLGEREFASGDSLGVVQIWDTVTATSLQRFLQHQADVLCLAAADNVLYASGLDTKISCFAAQADGEDRWVFRSADFSHSHDVKALAVDNSSGRRPKWYASGGVTGKLWIHGSDLVIKKKKDKKAAGEIYRPLHCSEFSPKLQVASVAEDSRVVLCQRGPHLELWYIQPPKEAVAKVDDGADIPVQAGMVKVASSSLPEPQFLLRVALSNNADGQHLTASAMKQDGRRFAASDFAGTRLFHLNIEELEVRSEKALPAEVRKTAASALLFFGSGSLLALASWGTGELLIVDTSRLAIVARLTQHKAHVTHLAATGEWLASSDVTGETHIFSVDTLQHHVRVPIGSSNGFPTALGFDARGKRLVVVLSSHQVVVFDVEAQALVSNVPTPSRIPATVLDPHQRISGVVASPGRPDKVILWGHQCVVSLDLTAAAQEAPAAEDEMEQPTPKKARKNKKQSAADAELAEEPEELVRSQGPFQRFRHMKTLLAMAGLDESRWGNKVLQGYCLQDSSSDVKTPEKKGKKRPASGNTVSALALTLEVSQEAAEKSLPQAFERKQFIGNAKSRR